MKLSDYLEKTTNAEKDVEHLEEGSLTNFISSASSAFKNVIGSNTLKSRKDFENTASMSTLSGAKKARPEIFNKDYTLIATVGKQLDAIFSGCFQYITETIEEDGIATNLKYNVPTQYNKSFAIGLSAIKNKDNKEIADMFRTKFGNFVNKLKEHHLLCNIDQNRSTKQFFITIDLKSNLH